MGENKTNQRHQQFKSELRRYHDSINRKNRYNLPKIAGKLDVFEAFLDDEDKETDSENEKVEIDRIIPNTALSVLVRNGMQAIGDRDGKPLTDFKYSFIEGAMGNQKKIISCVTDDGKIEYFDVENEMIVECAGAAPMAGIGVADVGCAPNKVDSHGDYHEVDYNKVRKDLEIPFLSGYRIKDMTTGRLQSKGIHNKKKRHHRR